MQAKIGSRSGVLQWVVVLVVGVLVVTVVLGLNLIPRLNDGQKVLNAAKPAFAAPRLAGARAGIDLISKNADTADPLMTPKGGAAAEVPKLIAFVSQKTGLVAGRGRCGAAEELPAHDGAAGDDPALGGDGRAARPAHVPREDAEGDADPAARAR